MNMCMNSKKKTYEDILAEMGEPIDIDSLPNRNLDLKGIMRYAKNVGKKVSELTEEEKNRFIQK